MLFSIVFTINVRIGTYFIYYKDMNRNKETIDRKNFIFRQQLLDVTYWTYKWDKVKEINIKNQTYYFFSEKINIKNLYSNLLKIGKKSYKNIDIYYIGYIMVKIFGDCGNIHSVNPLYFVIDSARMHFKEKKNCWFDRQIGRSFIWN